ncbi:competence protein CoiA [Oceanobacter mangrovi]|uniref:competence protein CoiA n=1 Tax=Oceanobacter mangrovi TaxID=2862510 RepID=UPI001C8D1BC8|nr:competence protein CoiA family protein [Oceanobacter mangrovi]
MPIACLTKTEERLLSFEFSSDEWKKLKREYQGMGIYMKCCNAPAIPKTSKNGVQFFAHKVNSCGTGSESEAHIRCKELIVIGARKAGWEAEPEEPGQDQMGNKWVADVLCSRRSAKVAFEVQLARQSLENFVHRTNRYKNSGVRCLWFVERKPKVNVIYQSMIRDSGGHYPDRESLPVFSIDVSDVKNPFVFFPWVMGDGPYEIPLKDFIRGALSGNLTFKDGRWRWMDCYQPPLI